MLFCGLILCFLCGLTWSASLGLRGLGLWVFGVLAFGSSWTWSLVFFLGGPLGGLGVFSVRYRGWRRFPIPFSHTAFLVAFLEGLLGSSWGGSRRGR